MNYELKLVRDRSYKKKQRLNRIKLQQCTQCGKPAAAGKVLCKFHNKQINTQKREKNAQKRLDHICITCAEPAIGTCGVCLKHYLMRQARLYLGNSKLHGSLYKLLINQNQTCFYCGVLLGVGSNSQIDHKNPRSRFPDQAHNIDNFVWACMSCNKMKGDRTAEEFISACKAIAAKWI